MQGTCSPDVDFLSSTFQKSFIFLGFWLLRGSAVEKLYRKKNNVPPHVLFARNARLCTDLITGMEAQLLYEPISEKLPSAQLASTFVIMLANPSYPQLKHTLREFEKLVKTDTEKIINRSLTGSVAVALLALGEWQRQLIARLSGLSEYAEACNFSCPIIVRIAKNKEGFFADQLYRALQGMGRDDKHLVRLIVSRSEKDLGSIKAEFEKQYKISLDTLITVRIIVLDLDVIGNSRDGFDPYHDDVENWTSDSQGSFTEEPLPIDYVDLYQIMRWIMGGTIGFRKNWRESFTLHAPLC